MSEDIVGLAEDYLEAYNTAQTYDDADLEIVREEREKWQSKMEELDEEDPLYEVAKENFEQRDEKIEERQQSEERYSQLKSEFLQSVAEEFIPRDEWLNEDVLRALNLALLGADRDYIRVETVHIEKGSNLDDDEEMFEIAMAVRGIAKEELRESTSLKVFWEDFTELDRFELFEEVVEAEKPLTGGEIAERRGEEENRQAISQALIDTTKGDVNPYFKQGRGEYSLSLVGEYLIQTFSGDDIDGEDSENGSAATLNDF